MRPGSFARDGPHEDLLGLGEVAAPHLEARALEGGEARPGLRARPRRAGTPPPRRRAAPSFSRRRAEVEAHAREERVRAGGVVLLSAGVPRAAWLLSRMERNAVSGLREAAARGVDPAEVEAGAPARERRRRTRGARVAFRRERSARSRSRCAFAVSMRSGAGGREGRVVSRRASRGRARRRPRRRAAPRAGSPRGAPPRLRVSGLVERLGAQGEEAASLARGGGRPRGTSRLPGRRRRGASRARRARCGARVARRRLLFAAGAEGAARVRRRRRRLRTGACRRRGGPARRGGRRRDVAFEERDGLVPAPVAARARAAR